MKWTPIFKQGDLEFVVPYESMVGDSENEAWEIAMGTMLVEGVLMGFKATNRCLEIDDNGKVNVTGWHSKLGPWDIVILDTTAAKVGARNEDSRRAL